MAIHFTFSSFHFPWKIKDLSYHSSKINQISKFFEYLPHFGVFRIFHVYRLIELFIWTTGSLFLSLVITIVWNSGNRVLLTHLGESRKQNPE